MRKKTGQTEKSEKAKIVGSKVRESRSPIGTATHPNMNPIKKDLPAKKEERPVEASNADRVARRAKMKPTFSKEDDHGKEKNKKSVMSNAKEKTVLDLKEAAVGLNDGNIAKKIISRKSINNNSINLSKNKPNNKNSNNKKEILKEKNLDSLKTSKNSKNLETDDFSSENIRHSQLNVKSYQEDIKIQKKKIFDLENIINGLSQSVAETNKKIAAYETEIKTMSAIASQNEDDNRKLKEKNNILFEDLKTYKSKISENYREIALLTRILKFSEHEISINNEKNTWMREVISKVLKMPKGWRFLTERQFLERIHRRLKRSELFDADHYLEIYPDVREIGMDPLKHYILHGMNENRSKNP